VKNWRVVALWALVQLSFVGGSAAARDPAASGALSGQLVVSGSSTMAPLVTTIAERYRSLHPGVHIEVRTGGSARGVADVLEGRANVGMVSRVLGEAERNLYGLPIARDGVALVVHKRNPVPALSDAQVESIFAGMLTHWRQVGGLDAPILTIAGTGGSATELFKQYFDLARAELRAQQQVGGNKERLSLLAKHPNAILYMSVGVAEHSVTAGHPVRLLPVGGVAASSRSIRAGDYPISRPLTLVTRGRPTGLVRSFIEFCASSQVTDLVVAQDFVPYLD
jgi:phosphate transport system substrate-binding protein